MHYTRHPAIVQVLEEVFGEPVIQASIGTMFDKVAGGDAEIAWHQDNFFIVNPPEGEEENLDKYWNQFGHVHVRPAEIDWREDYLKKTIIIRINVDPQTVENGALDQAVVNALASAQAHAEQEAWQSGESHADEAFFIDSATNSTMVRAMRSGCSVSMLCPVSSQI